LPKNVQALPQMTLITLIALIYTDLKGPIAPERALRVFAGFILLFPVVQSGSTLLKTHAPQVAQAAIRAHPCEKEAGDGNFIMLCM